MEKTIQLIIYLCCVMLVKAYSQNVGTLNSLLKCTTSSIDTVKFEAFRELTSVYLSTDNNKALNYSLKAYALAKKTNSKLSI